MASLSVFEIDKLCYFGDLSIDNINLSSLHTRCVPSGKNSDLLSGSCSCGGQEKTRLWGKKLALDELGLGPLAMVG
jgi:hypothetical protein